MPSLHKKTFDSPDDVRTPYEKGRVDVVDTPQGPVKRVTLEPGWRWTERTKPVVGTDLCEIFHVKLILAGTFGVRTADGTEMEFDPGDLAVIETSHDAWVVGNEPVEFLDLAEVVRLADPQGLASST